VWAGIFSDTGLSGCNKLALYTLWGTTLRLTHDSFRDANCSYCGLITPNVALANNTATGMLSRIDVTVFGTAALPDGTVLGRLVTLLQATPVTPFVPVPFTPAAASASGNLGFTGIWNASFTLATGDKTEECRLPSQNVTCMPTFVRAPSGSGSCECRPGYQNTDGVCTLITRETACAVATFLPNTTQLTDNATVTFGLKNASAVTVLMRPTVVVRNASASNPSALLGLGKVVPGDYDIELEEGGSRCTLRTVTVGCSPGYVPAGGTAGVCILPILNNTCTELQWHDGTSCRQKAEMTVQASSDTVQMTVVKSKSGMSANASAELRLKSGDVLDDAKHHIGWTAALATTSWLKLNNSAGVVYSSQPVAEVLVIADLTGLSDTAVSGPLVASITFTSNSARVAFVAGPTDVRSINVSLAIKAVPYVESSDVKIATSSGRATRSPPATSSRSPSRRSMPSASRSLGATYS
jgi:hypothetical protein